MTKLRKKGKDIQPIEIEGRAIARSFWGKRWCEHLESFSDYCGVRPWKWTPSILPGAETWSSATGCHALTPSASIVSSDRREEDGTCRLLMPVTSP